MQQYDRLKSLSNLALQRPFLPVILHTVTVWSSIGIIHNAVCLSVMLRIVAKWLHPTAKASEQVNRKCPAVNMMVQRSTPYTDPVHSNSPFPTVSKSKISTSGIALVSILHGYSRECRCHRHDVPPSATGRFQWQLLKPRTVCHEQQEPPTHCCSFGERQKHIRSFPDRKIKVLLFWLSFLDWMEAAAAFHNLLTELFDITAFITRCCVITVRCHWNVLDVTVSLKSLVF